MSLTRAYEEHELGTELRRIYHDIRASFDLSFVPDIFKLAAGSPEYLKLMWNDLGPVARSKEFQAAAKALQEFIRSEVISGGWRFSDQQKVLASQRFSAPDIEMLSLAVSTFARVLPQMVLFSRLMQRGYSGGQRGRVSEAKQPAALARLTTLHIPNEREAGLRVWLIYSDIKRTTGIRNVMSIYRMLSPFPGYLASVWMDSKKIFAENSFPRARDQISKRALGLLVGLPVKDHRAVNKNLTPVQWREIEQVVDGFARLLPQFALLCSVWQRSMPVSSQFLAA